MNRNGFTLIELIVVIVLVGILSVVAAAKYIDLTERANRAHDKAQLDACRTVTTLLYASNLLGNVTNEFGTYWPSNTNVVYSNLTEEVNWLYFTTVSYDPTNGRWTAQPD